MLNNLIIVKPNERRKRILRWLEVIDREWYVEELAEKLNVSHQTIRRDLVSLEAADSIIRTLGGCIFNNRDIIKTTYYKVSELNFTHKRFIGMEASKLIQPGNVILIADGSTNYHLASQLGNCGHVVVYTNSISASTVLGRFSNIDLYLLGGRFDINNEMIFLRGNMTEQMLMKLDFDFVFVSTDAIDENGTCQLRSEDIARTNQIILERGKQKILLADPSKTKATGNFPFAKLSDFDLWITTVGIEEKLMQGFMEQASIKEVSINPYNNP